MAVKQFTSSAGAANAELIVAQIGGPVGAVQLATPTVLTSGLPQNFVADRSGARFFYFIDGNGNILSWDRNNPNNQASIMISQATIGDTPVYIEIAMDSSALYFTTVGNKVFQALTAAPHTVTLIAGSGQNAHTNGTGAAASFATPMGISIDQASGTFLYVWNVGTGGMDKVVIATGVVTTLFNGYQGGVLENTKVGKSGRVYFCDQGGQSVKWKSVYGSGYGKYQLWPGQYVNQLAIDNDEPGETNIYVTVANSNNLQRINLATVTLDQVAVCPNIPTTQGEVTPAAQCCYRYPAVYLVDGLGNLLDIRNIPVA
jgi:hypothetical protein